jgi:tetratricopeptide (TPR) repeat protein
LRETSLQAFLRELATFNRGLCVITTRIPVADIAEYEHSSAPRHELEELSCHAGARLLQASGVKGAEEDLQSASSEFRGHCLALTLLGSYLTDAYNGDIRYREEVSARLIDDTRQGAHARKVMASYQAWFGEGPELSVLRMLGLFDRPVDEDILRVLLGPPVILGLTESLTNFSPTQWRSLISKLRRARLLAGEDPHRPGLLDTHPLVREYFGDQLRSERLNSWQECNRRLYNYFRALSTQLPDCVRDMEPLFLAVISACNAGLYREALHEIYIPRIQRGNTFFASKVLGARGALVSVLSRFFEPGRWGSPAETELEEHKLSKEDQLFLLMQAALLLTATRGVAVPEARTCYERAEALCRLLNRPADLYAALMGQLRHSSATDKLTVTLRLAEKIRSLAEQQNEPALMLGAYRALASTLYFLGDFESAYEYAGRGVEIWRSGKARHLVEEVTGPAVACLYNRALAEWQLGKLVSSQANMTAAISLAKETNDSHGLAACLSYAGFLAQCERKVAEAERLASTIIEMSTRHDFALWLARAKVLRGWVRGVSGNPEEGISWIRDGIAGTLELGTKLLVPYMLALKAEALYLADRPAEALEAIDEADRLAGYSEERWLDAELYRLRGSFLAAIGGDEEEIQHSFIAAIETAKRQKSVPYLERAEKAYAEYQRQKRGGPGRHGLRLPLC